jgi:pyrimidine operon attenuation protein / uracil phosphoribosyltransferase
MNKNKSQIICDSKELTKIINQISSQIQKKYSNKIQNVVLIGILSAGYPIAQRISKEVFKNISVNIPVGKLDIAIYRDDLLAREDFVPIRESDIPFDIENKIVILIDDVLFHGRTIRAALNGLLDFGSPKAIELAVLIDRGHKELPIFANYIGKEIKTNKTDYINVSLVEIGDKDSIVLEGLKK